MAIRLFQNLALKVVSVVLAALLWLIVSGEQTVERVLRIPLEFTNMPAQLELVGEPPTVVDVRVRGSSGTLGRLSSGELAAVLDVRSPRPGQRLYHLTGSDVRAPFGVDVVQVDALVHRVVLRAIVGQDRAGVAGARRTAGRGLCGGQGHRRPVEGRDRRTGQLPQVALRRGNRSRVRRGRHERPSSTQ